MNKVLDFFKGIFTPATRSSNSTDRLFADWDLLSYEDLLSHFNVKRTAIEKGKQNSPNKNAPMEDDFHNSLKTRYQSLIAKRTEEVSRRIESIETQSAKADENIKFLDDAKKEFQSRINEDLESLKPAIDAASSQVKSLQQEVKDFKVRNQLTRDANYPDSAYWYYFTLVALATIESLFNGALFQSGSASGFLGGVSIAIGISAANVIHGYLVGAYWGKQAFSIHQPVKAIGYLGFASWAFLTAAFNLAVGHVRALYETGIYKNAFTAGFESFLAGPLNLVDFTSWLLVFVGVLFSIIALFDGLKVDDKYPGYGAITRKLRAAEDALIDELDQLKAESNKLYEFYRGGGDDRVRNLNTDAISLRENHDFIKERVRNEYPKYCSYYSDVFARLIASYREHNLEAREDEGPEYFKEIPEFPYNIDSREEQLKTLSDKIDDIASEANAVTTKWSQDRSILDELKTEFTNTLRQYDEIS
ncbi:hypothetical protein N9W64_00560 [Gammaproteobacteria bacterium]|nr:hypothetical protein [Gammaproteobacteria bacterium]